MSSAVVQAGMNMAGTLLSNELARSRETQGRQENFFYGELAADNAQKRTIDLYNKIQSPKALLQQYKDAGLSPSMMFGGSGVGGQATPGAQGNGASGIAPTTYGIDPVQLAEIELMKAQTKNVNAQTNTINGENDRGKAEINKIIQETNNARLQEDNIALENTLKNFEVAIKGATGHTEVKIKQQQYETLRREYEILENTLRSAKANADIDEQKVETILQYYSKQVAELGSRILLNNANARLANSAIKLNEQQVNKLVNDILIDNENVAIKRSELRVNEGKLKAQIEQWATENGFTERGQNIKIAEIILDFLHSENKNSSDSLLGLLSLIIKVLPK